MSDLERFDVLVIGAGVGGICAAVRLAQQGRRVLLVEAEQRVGGRASSREVDGFILNTGALAIERDGPVADLYADLGLHLDLHVPQPETAVLWGHRVINVATGPAGRARTILPRLLRTLTDRLPTLRPRPGQSTADWINRFTSNPTVHGLVDNVCGSFFAVAGADVPADVFLHYVADGSAFKKLGFPRGGTIEVWKPLVDYVTSHGGQLWLDAEVTSLVVDSGAVHGALIRRGGTIATVEADAVVSNIGPVGTARLIDPSALPAGYAETIERSTRYGTILTVHFASREPLASWPAIGLAARSRRLTYLHNASAPEQRRILKPGWFLYSAASTPRPATGSVDVAREQEELLADLRDHLPGFDEHAVILDWDINNENNPAQRSVSGFDHPVDTPLPNLWNVGDGVKPWGDAGTAACVRSADTVVERLMRTAPITS